MSDAAAGQATYLRDGAAIYRRSFAIIRAEADLSRFTPEQAEILDKALEAAGVPHTIETYHAAHGFAVPDNPPYDVEAAQRHWLALQLLFEVALPG